jgi:hypothetical protein
MIQTILIGLLFAGALSYLILMVRKQFVSKDSCAKGCACSSIDLEKIEKEMNTRKN